MTPFIRKNPSVENHRVVIVGGGIAGIEALMALADLGDRRLDIELVADKPHFILRPQIIGEPWGGEPLRVDLARLCQDFGAAFRIGTVIQVDAQAHEVLTAAGESIAYDRLLLAPGTRTALAFTGTRTVTFGSLPRTLATSETGSVAVAIPSAVNWTLPAYELALLVAGSGRPAMVLSNEYEPLEVFGPETRLHVRSMLDRHGVLVNNRGGRAPVCADSELADTVVSLPLQHGPAITGLPVDEHGFIDVDDDMLVTGLPDVWAAGDAISGSIKQGGLAAQQADSAASQIVRSCGGDAPAIPYEPVLRGKLTAPDGEELYLRRALDGIDRGEASSTPLWQPANAVCAWRLARWLGFRKTVVDDCELGHLARPSSHVVTHHVIA